MCCVSCFELPTVDTVFPEPVKIYCGVLGQIGDVIMYSAVARRLRQLYPNASITLSVSQKYREAGQLVAGLPYVDRLFVSRLYFERLTPMLFQPWERGWPVDLRGDDEVLEERDHLIVLTTRPRHRRSPWWEHGHAVEEMAHMVGVPGPIDCRTEIRVPDGVAVPEAARGKIVLHNDPAADPRKAWSWDKLRELVEEAGAPDCVLLGGTGPEVSGVLDLRGKTTLAEAAAIIQHCHCYVGIDSGLMWIAGSLQRPVVGLYASDYIGKPEAVQPVNPNAVYLSSGGSMQEIGVDAVVKAVLGR